MMNFVRCSGIYAILGLFVFGVNARAEDKEEDVPLSKLPKAVMKAVKDKFPDAKQESAVKGKDDDGPYFEVVLHQKERHIFVVLTPEGKINEVSREIEIKNIPAPVSKAVNAKHAKCKIELALEVTDETVTKDKLSYDVFITKSDKKKLHLTLDPKGKILEEVEEPEEK